MSSPVSTFAVEALQRANAKLAEDLSVANETISQLAAKAADEHVDDLLMMHAHPINRDDGETRGRGRAALGGCDRTSFDHHKFRRARPPSRPTGRSMTRSGTFYRLGWTGDLNTIDAVRTRIVAGTDERLAALLEALNSGHQPAVQAFADVPENHSSAPSRDAVAVEATQPREALNAVHEIHEAGSSHDR